jgi:hypothetical protein
VRYLGILVRFGFSLQAFLGIFTVAIAPSMVERNPHQSFRSIAITLVAGVYLFASLNLLPGIAAWTLCQGKRSAHGWSIAASLVDIAWSPLVARCTESTAVVLALIGICGLIETLGQLLLKARERMTVSKSPHPPT